MNKMIIEHLKVINELFVLNFLDLLRKIVKNPTQVFTFQTPSNLLKVFLYFR